MKRILTLLLLLSTMATTISAQSLSERQKHLGTIAALEAQGDLVRLEPAIVAALDGGITINEIKEAFSQLYAYTGFPRSLNALGVLSKVIEAGNGKWTEGKPWVRPAVWDDANESLAIGTEIQTKLSGRPFNYEFCPQNDYYLKAHLFGDIFAGDQLSAADREIVTVAALSALKGVAPQLAAHKAGAVNMGNTQEQVDELCRFLSVHGLSQCDASADACAGSWPKGNPNDAYAQYFKDFNEANHFDIMVGYEWQHFWRHLTNEWTGYYPSTNNNSALAGKEHEPSNYEYKTESYLVSFFGRANYSLLDRYMLTFTVRRDGTSRFKNHWSTFPSAAFAWKINQEKFLEEASWLSDLKLRLGWGMTGQQEGVSDYNWIATYSKNSGNGSYYPATGDGSLYRPDNFTPELKWETTTTTNVGLDLGVLNQRLTFAADWYYRKTTDLLNYAPAPIMTAFRNKCWQNIGSLKNTGVEFAIDWKAVQTKDWFWSLTYNITYNKNEITDLTGVSDGGSPVETGPDMGGGTGNKGMANQVGSPANSFYVYQQVYDENGLPIENLVVDRNGDGQITSADRYLYKSIMAPLTMGLSSRLEYKSWDLGMSMRASFGNYVYNNVEQSYSNNSKSSVWTSSNYMANRMPITLDRNYQTDELSAKLTDYYVQNASYLKLDNITLGYSFQHLLKTGNYKGLGGRAYFTVNNVACITKYKGLDPECPSGVDSNMYPRPISFILGLNLNF